MSAEMTPADFGRVRAAFEQARKLSTVECSAFVVTAFDGEPSLAALLARMVAGASRDFLEPPSTLTLGGAIESGTALTSGTRLGGFVLEEIIGVGGMGEVWRARQEKPERRVAVKVLRGGLETERSRSRFIEEAELLARLSHPGIARVFASGVFEVRGSAPRPWFAMELIEGATDIIQFASKQTLEPNLRLIRSVAEAVHHGHLRGVVHRDLKPDNILVDRDGRAHVIDFGIARVSDHASGAQLTQTDEFLGTLAYMAPEQVQGDHANIDMRSDVHALGVLLYELLTGVSPWAASSDSWAALAREVCEIDPTPPSRVDGEVSVELDWIVARALAKDPGERYASAEAFGADLDRFLSHEPLSAGPPTASYRARKFARRNRAWVTGGAVAVTLLILGTAGTGWGLYRATERGEELAEQTERLKTSTRQLEERGVELEASTAREMERANRAIALNEFLNEALRLSNPITLGLGRHATVGEMLDLAAERVDSAFPDRPDLEAETRLLIGTSLESQGHYKSAIAQLTRAKELFEELGDLQSVRAARRLAVAHAHDGDWQLAYDMMNAAHDRGYAELPEDAAERYALDIDLAWLLQEVGQVAKSVPIARRGVEGLRAMGVEYKRLAALGASNLARGLRALGDDVATEEAYQLSIELQAEAFGESSANVGIAQSNYGAFLYARGRNAEALAQFESALKLQRAGLDADHPILATTLYNLAAAQQDTGDLDGALATSIECLAQLERTLGPDHQETVDARGALGFVQYAQADFVTAARTFQRFADELSLLRGEDDRRTIQMRVRTADSRMRSGDGAGAATLRSIYEEQLASQGLEGELTKYTARAAVRAGVEL